ncbi:hypothetical protein GCM10010233_56470 [Streptomyces pseudogriseolus]|nr:hypothetical protein GCM10010233_56470 [Streptomyces gancidicus]
MCGTKPARRIRVLLVHAPASLCAGPRVRFEGTDTAPLGSVGLVTEFICDLIEGADGRPGQLRKRVATGPEKGSRTIRRTVVIGHDEADGDLGSVPLEAPSVDLRLPNNSARVSRFPSTSLATAYRNCSGPSVTYEAMTSASP